MNTYKVTFTFNSLKLNVKLTCVHVVIEASTEDDAKLIAKELLNPIILKNIKQTTIIPT